MIISTGFLAVLLTGLTRGTLFRQPDEGTVAHLFQVLMPLQLIIVGLFAVSWLPRSPRAAMCVLALPVTGFFAVLGIVYSRHL